MLSNAGRAFRWIAQNSVARPGDISVGFIAATILVYFWGGPNSLFQTLLDIFATFILLYVVYRLCNWISDWAEHSVFKLPEDERTKEAQRQVDAMVEEALD